MSQRWISVVLSFTIVMAACSKSDDDASGGKSVTYDTPQGKVTVSGQDGRKMAIDTPDGRVTYEVDENGGMKTVHTAKDGTVQTTELASKVDLAAFEGLVYPGAVAQSDGFVSAKGAGFDTKSGQFVSADGVDKVTEHYKKALPDASVTSAGGITMVVGKTKAGGQYSIMISPLEDSGKSNILISTQK
jgi:hypothetical protein